MFPVILREAKRSRRISHLESIRTGYAIHGYRLRRNRSEAPDRRKAVRPAHIDGVRELKAAGNLIAGGAILNEKGEMIGSTLYVEFETREELNEWLNRDPYVSGGVWQDITVTPIRLANLD